MSTHHEITAHIDFKEILETGTTTTTEEVKLARDVSSANTTLTLKPKNPRAPHHHHFHKSHVIDRFVIPVAVEMEDARSKTHSRRGGGVVVVEIFRIGSGF